MYQEHSFGEQLAGASSSVLLSTFEKDLPGILAELSAFSFANVLYPYYSRTALYHNYRVITAG